MWGITAIHMKQRDEYPNIGFATLAANCVLMAMVLIVVLRYMFPAIRSVLDPCFKHLSTQDQDKQKLIVADK